VSVGLSGNLSDFSIADVFQLIGHQRKTGTLELKSGAARAQLVFDRGMVVSAAVRPRAHRRPGPACAAAGALRAAHARARRRGAAVARSSAQSVARTLVARGWLDAATVRRALDLVTSDAIFDVLRWHGGSFDFHSKSVDHDRDPGELLAPSRS
jgi:hypothetical protein